MNPIAALRRELAETSQELDRHTNKYPWLTGYGTGWKGSHYGMSENEYQAAYDRTIELRGRIIAIDKEIARLRKIARPCYRTSLLVHGGR